MGERTKKHIKKEQKHIKTKNIHGIVPGFFLGDFLYVFSLPHKDDPRKTHKQILATHPVPGQSPKFVYVYVLSSL